MWMFRVMWIALAFTMAPAIGDALAERTRSVQLLATVGAWLVWAVVLLASLVPTTVSLTVVRVIAPGALVVGAVVWAAGASTAAGATAAATGGVATALAFSGDLGQVFAQGSAYGDEQRFPLRPPGPVLALLPVTWTVLAASWLLGPLALAAGQWIVGFPVTLAALALAWTLGRRFHCLSRRWLVLVPAGIVVHDHLVLAETAMMARTEVASAGLAFVGTEAADLTGTALGPAVELRLLDVATVVLAAPPRGSTRALHVRSILISPTRPGRALRALGTAGVRVG